MDNIDITQKNKQWEYVQRIGQKFNIDVTNLTLALISESDRLLKEGRLIFWQDGTHWNKYGIAAASGIVARKIFQMN